MIITKKKHNLSGGIGGEGGIGGTTVVQIGPLLKAGVIITICCNNRFTDIVN